MNEPDRVLSPLKEAVIFFVSIIVGAVGLPALSYAIGRVVLGPYAGGGLGAIIEHEFRGLGTGATSSWMIALVPYVIVVVVRLIWNCDRIHRRLWPDRDRLQTEHGADRGTYEVRTKTS